ncbi:MAG: helix-turn-helix transcriptional regulator, partial [Firmicutes bacterium]|nr:helix-turn-helix transcriptional regulator [Bacillota bacterium]
MEEKTFGERLKKLRKEANITQNDFADKLLVHSQTVSRWERG